MPDASHNLTKEEIQNITQPTTFIEHPAFKKH
jgi:hypothetical protein